ncbi:MAG: TIGR04084 family radical SAM/SPASM domain-containing protein [Candidatus Aenigmatarchaeota archaeon]
MFYHIILTTECNGKCVYCYEKSLEDMEEEHSIDIDFSVPENLSYEIDDLKKFISKDKEPTLTFYGGEPLLRIDLIKKIMDSIEARYMMQTNAFLLNQLPKRYANRFHTILVSLDGNEETTDRYRGKGAYKKVMKNISLLKSNGFKGEIIARMTIEEQDIYESVLSLVENGFTSVHWQLDANFWKHDYTKRNFLNFAKNSYNPGIEKLIDFWLEEMKKGKVLKLYPLLDIVEDMLLGRKSFLRCGSGYTNFTILTNGKIVPCPIMVGMREFYLGDIWKSDPKNLRINYVWREPCVSCEIFEVCGGRCLYANYLQPWGLKGTKEVCFTVKFLIKNLEKKIPEIRKLVKNKIIKMEDFTHVKYNGCEIIP